jgi:hypothetical protein
MEHSGVELSCDLSDSRVQAGLLQDAWKREGGEEARAKARQLTRHDRHATYVCDRQHKMCNTFGVPFQPLRGDGDRHVVGLRGRSRSGSRAAHGSQTKIHAKFTINEWEDARFIDHERKKKGSHACDSLPPLLPPPASCPCHPRRHRTTSHTAPSIINSLLHINTHAHTKTTAFLYLGLVVFVARNSTLDGRTVPASPSFTSFGCLLRRRIQKKTPAPTNT